MKDCRRSYTRTQYQKARQAIPIAKGSRAHSVRSAPKKSKWQKKENLELIKKAVDVFKETSDLEKTAEILNIKALTLKTYMYSQEAAPNMIYKHFRPYRHLINPNYDQHEHLKKARNSARAGIRAHRESCANAGLDYKDYFAYLKHTCDDKRATTREIKSLNESIRHLVDTKGNEQQLKVLREKVRLAKSFFKSQKY